MEREVSLPFAPPLPAPARRTIERAETSALRLEVASVLEQRAEDIAARWWEDARTLLSVATISTAEGTSTSPDAAPRAQAAALVRCVAAALVARDGATGEAAGLGASFGTSVFAQGETLHQALRAFERLIRGCLDVIEGAVSSDCARVEAADAMHVCRTLLEAAESIRLAAVRGFIDAANLALQERFRHLRHDLRNPIATIRSALSLMADETVPEEARRSPRFRVMIERNAAVLDQLIVHRLSDAGARLVPVDPRAAESGPTSLGGGEARDDLTRSRERDDRQAGSL